MARRIYKCFEGHTAGNPVRLYTTGHPELKGETMADRRVDFIQNHDHIRTALMFEPRGSSIMSGGFLYPTSRPDCDIGVLYIEVSGALPMCGHGTIGIVTMALENGIVTPKTEGVLCLETPAGRVDAHFERTANGKVTAVKLINVPSFLMFDGVEVKVEDLGPLTVDIAYGGNFYAIIEPQENYAGLDSLKAAGILRHSAAVRRAVNAAIDVVHPEDANIAGVSHVQWTDTPKHPDATHRNAVFYGDTAIDRSPCGTGTSARMAQLYARGDLKPGERFVHESYIGSLFEGTIEEDVQIAQARGIRPGIKGSAYQTGCAEHWIDDDAPFPHGFQVT